MKVLINAVTINESIRGVERHILELTRHLAKIDKKNEYYILKAKWQKYMPHLDVPNFHFITWDIPRRRLWRNAWESLVFPMKIKHLSFDLLHLPNTMPLFIKIRPTIVTIHDLAEFYLPQSYSIIQSISRRIIVRCEIHKADRIITISHYVKNAIIKNLKVNTQKINVIYNGINQAEFEFPILPDSNRIHHLPSKYILFVGVIERIKNVGVLIEAFNLLDQKIKSGYKMVIAGMKGNNYEYIQGLIKTYSLEKEIIYLGQVNDELPYLYRNASLFVFPSLVEGFGLPVIEAMAAETPVITSNTGALPEICGSAAILIDPRNVEELKKAIERVLLDKGLAEELKKRGRERIKLFSWEKTAEETLKIYEEVYKKRDGISIQTSGISSQPGQENQ